MMSTNLLHSIVHTCRWLAAFCTAALADATCSDPGGTGVSNARAASLDKSSTGTLLGVCSIQPAYAAGRENVKEWTSTHPLHSTYASCALNGHSRCNAAILFHRTLPPDNSKRTPVTNAAHSRDMVKSPHTLRQSVTSAMTSCRSRAYIGATSAYGSPPGGEGAQGPGAASSCRQRADSWGGTMLDIASACAAEHGSGCCSCCCCCCCCCCCGCACSCRCSCVRSSLSQAHRARPASSRGVAPGCCSN